MDASVDVVARWVGSLPPEATSERVRPEFFYVRLPGVARRWIPVEIEVGERTVRLTSHVIVPPEENHAAVYELLLRHNFRPSVAAFSLAPDGVICLTGAIPLETLDTETLDQAAGRIVELTEATFRSILQIGFASRLARRARR